MPDTLDTEATMTSNRCLLPPRNLKAVVKEILNTCIYRSVKSQAELSFLQGAREPEEVGRSKLLSF